MNKFIFCLIFVLTVPILAFSQTEQQQKNNIRNNTPSTSTTTTPPTTSKITQTEIPQKQEIRAESSRPTTTTNFSPRPRWNGYTRWNRWGAPYSYNRYNEIYFYDRVGYRTPVRIYQNYDKTLDTVVSKKNKVRLGINLSIDNQIGGWVTIGKSFYFKGQINKFINKDYSEFYSHPDVNFYSASITWQDKRLEDITKGWSLYLGVGRELKNFGINLSLGVGQEQENYQFFDEYYILSNNGKYSFKNFVDNYVSFSLGLTHDYNFISLSADFDPLRKTFYLGAGFNF